MNVFGIGGLELLVILLVAFIALGPGKTIEVARTIGRVAREARRTFTDIVDAASLTNDDLSARRDSPNTDSAPADPGQPPSDPLPMPTHLREPADSNSAQPESDGSDPASSQR